MVVTATTNRFTERFCVAFANVSDCAKTLAEDFLRANEQDPDHVSEQQFLQALRMALIEIANEKWARIIGEFPAKTVAYDEDVFTAADLAEADRLGIQPYARPIRRVTNR